MRFLTPLNFEVMNEIAEKGLELAIECGKKLNMNIVSVDYVQENGMKILRVICESTPELSIDDVTKLNELISDELDKKDFINEEYYLEVSSEGIEKELISDTDIINSIGQYVFVKTYEKINNNKDFYGDLVKYENDTVTLTYKIKNINKTIDIPKIKISLIRLAIKF